MNSSLVAIGTLLKSNISEKCLINFLMNLSNQALRDYLKFANICKGSSSKKKTDLVEMIVYGCITNKLNKNEIKDLSIKEMNKILKEHDIILKSLPGYGNTELKRQDLKPYDTSVDNVEI